MKNNNVIVYSTPTCPYCVIAKEFLKKNNIEFIDKDVSRDRNSANEMIAKSGQMGVPVLDINGEILVGYDPEAILSLVK